MTLPLREGEMHHPHLRPRPLDAGVIGVASSYLQPGPSSNIACGNMVTAISSMLDGDALVNSVSLHKLSKDMRTAVSNRVVTASRTDHRLHSLRKRPSKHCSVMPCEPSDQTGLILCCRLGLLDKSTSLRRLHKLLYRTCPQMCPLSFLNTLPRKHHSAALSGICFALRLILLLHRKHAQTHLLR